MLDDELRALLSPDPAPDFTARVRETVRNQRVHSAWAPRSTAPWMAFALASIVLGFALPYLFVTPNDASRVSLASTPIGTAQVPLKDAISSTAVRPVEAVASFASPALVRREELELQFDPAELRSLQALFARPPVALLDVPAPPTDMIVIPEMTVEPLQFEWLSEGDSQ